MNALATTFHDSLPVPTARAEIFYRAANRFDIPFMDQMQKLHAGKLGFQFLQSYEKAVAAANQVFIAEDRAHVPMGFIFGKDRYNSQDQVGIIFQLAVVPIKQRSLIGANLVKCFIDHAAYGMKLLCCYCAQDLSANHFWQAMGFHPIAFRTGSSRTERIHIFWERRVRVGDTTTPLWFPAITSNGAVAGQRVILPIPRDRLWSDPMPVVLPDSCRSSGIPLLANGLPDPKGLAVRQKVSPAQPAMTYKERVLANRASSRHLGGTLPGCVRIKQGGVYVNVRIKPMSPEEVAAANITPKKPSIPRPKVDPLHAAKSRELRDRFLEVVNEAGLIESGKYNPARLMENLPCTVGPLKSPSNSPLPLLQSSHCSTSS